MAQLGSTSILAHSRYEIVRELGAGSMGVVFEARDVVLGRMIALKLVRARASDSRLAQLQLHQEAQAMARLSHPNVASVFDIGRVGDRLFIAMELVRGTTLRSVVRSEAPWRDKLALAIAAGRGLAAAHDAGLVHRDFKPDNVLVRADGSVRVSDFGLARAVFDGDAQDGTSVGTTAIAGTLPYMAFESFDGVADALTDQFALAVTMFELLEGKRPFDACSSTADRRACLATDRRPVWRRRVVPRAIRSIIERGLALDRAARWPSVSMLCAALEQRLHRRSGARMVGIIGSVAFAVSAATLLAIRSTANDPESRAPRAALVRPFEESGRELVVGGHFEEAVPYLLAARRHGIDSPSLRMLFWAATRRQPLMLTIKHDKKVSHAVFSPDGKLVATTSGQVARIWDSATGRLVINPLEHQDEVSSAAFSGDGTRVVTASHDHYARVWYTATGKLIISPLKHLKRVTSAGFNPYGTRVLTVSEDQAVRVWDAATGKLLPSPLEHHGVVESAAFSPDGTRLVIATKDRAARIWDTATGKLLASPLVHRGAVVSAAFSADGNRIVTASDDMTAQIWDVATGKALGRPLYHQSAVRSATFSPDGTRVVTASQDHTARVWDGTTGIPVTSSLAHHAGVTSATFSPDGTRVVTASEDHTARVWDAAAGEPLTMPLAHQASVTSAVFSADGTRVVTASEDGTAQVWDVRLDDGTLEQWTATAGLSPFELRGGVLVRRVTAAPSQVR